MPDQPASSEDNRVQAAAHYSAGRDLEARRDYSGAMKEYEESLRLYDDPLVRAAYFRVVSAIGPM